MNMDLAWPWLVAVCWPLVVAVWVAVARRSGLAMAIAPWSAVPALAVALAAPAPADVPWLLMGARFELDEVGRTFLLFTAVLWLAGGVYARGYLARDPAASRFLACFLAAMAGNVGLVIAGDVVSFYTGFALMSFASYGLIVHTGEPEAVRAGRVYITLVVVSEICILAGLLAWAGAGGTLRLIGEGRAAASPGPIAIGLLFVGFGIKAGALPLHVWLPLAHPVAPTPASAVLSGAMIKAGLLGWIRFLPLGTEALPAWGLWCMGAGVLAAVVAAVAGTLQDNPKVTLAYSSISQMGVITAGVGAGLAAPEAWPLLLPAVALHALHHAWEKGAMFLRVGIAAHPGASIGWRRLVTAGLAAPALAMAGAPLTSGALAKLAVKSALPAALADALTLAFSLATVGTTLLMLRYVALTRPVKATGPMAPAAMRASWAALTALVIVAGLGAVATPGVAPADTLSPSALWSASWPLLAGIALYAAAVRYWPSSTPAPRVPAGDLLWPVLRAVGLMRPVRSGARAGLKATE